MKRVSKKQSDGTLTKGPVTNLRVRVGDIQVSTEEKKAVMEVLDSNRITEGTKVAQFENLFSRYLDVKNTVLVNSGTSALITGLNALQYTRPNIERGSSIITTPLTYNATINAAVLAGFKPKFVDVDIETFNIAPDAIKAHLERVDDLSEYSIILPVHLMGYPADMTEINSIAKKYDLTVFEDSAQAHGTTYKGKKCGSMSLASAFSFYVAHNIQVGEMGALSTNDDNIADFARRFKANGRMCICKVCTRSMGICPQNRSIEESLDPRFHHIYIGYNFKTTDLMAAIGIVQLEKADEIMKKRYVNVKYLNEGLEQLEDKIRLPTLSKDVSYLAYPLVIKNQNVSREKIMQQLEEKGVETRPLFSCIPLQQPAYSEYKTEYKEKLPNSECLGEKGFYLGCHQYLKESDLDFVIHALNSILV